MDNGIGEAIKKLRINNNMTQSELADKLFVSRELVCRWELGSRYPGLDILKSISELFRVKIDTLMLVDSKIMSDLGRCIPDGMGAAQASALINDFLRTLNEEDRDVFVLRYYKFRSTKDLSHTFRKSEGTVRNKLVSLRKDLSAYLEEYKNGQR